MKLGYNTNGFAHHRLEDAIVILAEMGYQSIAITLDHHALNPLDSDCTRQTDEVTRLLRHYGMASVFETGARFLLDPRRKHQPTLLDDDPKQRERRLDFLRRAVDIAHALGSNAVSFWSGAPAIEVSGDVLFRRLMEGCRALLEHANNRHVSLAFEPEPGMFIDTLAKYRELTERINHPRFGLTMDIGHVHCMNEGVITERIHEWSDRLFNVHIEDMRRGVHDHLFFGEGEIAFEPVLDALRAIRYAGGVHVELSRHSYDAVKTARNAIAFLQSALARRVSEG